MQGTETTTYDSKTPHTKNNVFIFAACCPRRTFDVNLLARYFTLNGWKIVDNADNANLVIIGTCAFNQRNEDFSVFSILQAKRLKTKGTKIVVIGCLPKINRERLRAVFSGDSLSPRELNKIDDIIHAKIKLSEVKEPNILREFAKPPLDNKGLFEPLYLDILLANLKKKNKNGLLNRDYFNMKQIVSLSPAYPDHKYTKEKIYNIKTSIGCLGTCSYCAIKFAVGRLKSKPIDEIMREFQEGLNKGFKIFCLVGEDVGAYGVDIGINIVALLRKIFNADINYKLIIKDINLNWAIKHYRDLINLLKQNYQKIDYIVIPIQSGSAKILRLMNRGYTAKEALRFLRMIKKEIPGLRICTHIMVGFPGETDNDFKKSLELMKAYPFLFIDLYEYNDRPNTGASRMKDKISERIKKLRYKEAAELRRKLEHLNNRK